MILKFPLRVQGLVLLGLVLFLGGCSNSSEQSEGINYKNRVVIQTISEPGTLNPVNYNDVLADEINHYIFQKLLDVDHKTHQLIPVLAETRPKLTQTPEGFLQVAYRINPKATWDNGKPITAKDVEFSLKVVLCPGVNNEANKPNFELIKDFKYSDEDPLAFTIIYKEKYIRGEFNSGSEYFILPSYIFDSAGVLAKYRLIDFIEPQRISKILNDKKLKAWVEQFNSELFSRNKRKLIGSGPYTIQNWTPNQEIRLVRKTKWWGRDLGSNASYFEANIEQIIYKIISDQTTALTALKSGQIDIMYGVKAKDFKGLTENKKLKDNFYFGSPNMLGYSYLGVNASRPILGSLTTRQALAHLIDVDQIIKTVNYGFAQRITGPVHPAKINAYDTLLKPYPFDLLKAKKILEEDGWKDTDGNGVLEKVLNGKKTEFKISLLVNAGNDDRIAIATLIKNWFAKAGVSLEIINQDWGVFLQNVNSRNFDLYYGAWFGEFAPEDHSQLFHTSQIAQGANYVSFGNKQTDDLIDSIKIELNEEKRNEMYKRFQRILYNQCNYLFLMSPNNNIVVNKKFKNVYFSAVYPGFWAAGFKLN